MSRLLLLAVFAFSVSNLTLTTGLGLRWISGTRKKAWKRALSFFISTLLLYFLFTFALARFLSGGFAVFILFPLCALFHWGIEHLFCRLHAVPGQAEHDPAPDGGDALCAAAVWIILQTASQAAEAFALAAGFAAGILFPYFAAAEISRRSLLERLPGFLRGKPLALITLGLLALVLSSVGMIVIGNR